MNFAEDADFFAVCKNSGLSSRNEARIVAFRNFVCVVKEIQQCRNFTCCIIEVCIACSCKKSQILARSCAGVFFFAKVGNFTDFKNFMRENCVCRFAFRTKQGRKNVRADELIVFAHRICNFNDVLRVYEHIVDVVFLASDVVKNHFLITKTDHQRFCFTAEIRYWKKATDCKVRRCFRFKIFKTGTNHYVFNNVDFVKEVVSVRSREKRKFYVISVFLSSYGTAHSCKRVNDFFLCKISTQKLVYSAEFCLCRRLIIERNYDIFSKTSFIRVLYADWFNFISAVSKIARNNVCRKDKVFHIVTGKFNHKSLVAYLNCTERCTINNRCH